MSCSLGGATTGSGHSQNGVPTRLRPILSPPLQSGLGLQNRSRHLPPNPDREGGDPLLNGAVLPTCPPRNATITQYETRRDPRAPSTRLLHQKTRHPRRPRKTIRTNDDRRNPSRPFHTGRQRRPVRRRALLH